LHSALVHIYSNQERFEREVKIASLLNHPNIVKVYESHWGDGRQRDDPSYYVMELLKGRSLHDHLEEPPGNRIVIEAATPIMNELCAAVYALHEIGGVHRDLKPSNVVLVPRLDDPKFLTVKLVDFGLSKILGAEQTITPTGHMAGSLQYMSPEEAQ